jgi:hypothetical protein
VVDLLVLAREFDLPPRWDGGPVEWGPWEPEIHVFICPAPSDMGACDQCGSLEPRITARGIVTPLPGVEREHPQQLRVTRCPDCKHDRVVDHDTFDVFDLDPSDYTESGSWPPADVDEPKPEPEPAPRRATRPSPAPKRTLTTSRPSRAPRARHDGSCSMCDDLHPPGAPCGRPSPPPPGWRPNLKGTPRG